MFRNFRQYLLLNLAAWLLVFALPAAAASMAGPAAAIATEIGFLVAAPDRGFLGNEEVRDQFEVFAAERNAALVFVTDERTRDNVDAALAGLAARGARRAVVLPLFMSTAQRRHATLRAAVGGTHRLAVSWAAPYGASYLAAEAIADSLRTLPAADGRRLVIAGAGAADRVGANDVAADLSRLAEDAAAGLGYAGVEALVWPERGVPDEDALRAEAVARLRALAGAVVVVVVEAPLGTKADSMMSFAGTLRRVVSPDSHLLPDPALGALALTWMRREANRVLPWSNEHVGVVVAAHGSDWHWNEGMREGARPLEARYPVEYAFSMADPVVLERAVRRLERRGARAIVIVRVFGVADSFERDIVHMIGGDFEAPSAARHAGAPQHAHAAPKVGAGTAGHAHAAHADHGGHGAHGGASARIRSSAVMLTVGGLDDHPSFASALLDRARALSTDPGRETLILTAHGSDDEARNAHWLKLLESIAARMRANGGADFKAIRVATWREDWPDKREPWVARVRGWVTDAARDGTAIVIAARTTNTGPEEKLLSGLPFRLGGGFAPHPLFAQWLGEQVERAVAPAPTVR